MQVIFLGDLHIGARGASLNVAEHQIEFFESTLVPYMIEHSIDTIIQLGDIFDTRKFTNHVVLDMWQRRVFSLLTEHNIKMFTLIGNHDIAYKNTLDVSSPKLFFNNTTTPTVTVIDSPTTLTFDGCDILCIPWICDENNDSCMAEITSTNASVCAGHFEINGFEYNRGHMCEDGLDTSVFKKFEHVFSGHFHTRSARNNIQYIGTPYELTWIDYDDPKGFGVFDTDTRMMEFVRNPKTLHHKVYYNDKDQESDYYKSIDVSRIANGYVKAIIVEKTDADQYERFMSVLDGIHTIDLKVVDSYVALDDETSTKQDIVFTDAPSMIDSYVNHIETPLDKNRLAGMLKTKYTESLDIII